LDCCKYGSLLGRSSLLPAAFAIFLAKEGMVVYHAYIILKNDISSDFLIFSFGSWDKHEIMHKMIRCPMLAG
jgi:hypothetical protein